MWVLERVTPPSCSSVHLAVDQAPYGVDQFVELRQYASRAAEHRSPECPAVSGCVGRKYLIRPGQHATEVVTVASGSAKVSRTGVVCATIWSAR